MKTKEELEHKLNLRYDDSITKAIIELGKFYSFADNEKKNIYFKIR